MPGPWQRFVRLPMAGQLATAEALVVVVWVRMAVTVLPGSVLGRWVGHAMGSTCAAGGASGPAVETVCRAVRRASVRVPGATCLVQALSGWMMLARRGVPARLELGVDKTSQGLDAHAWLVVDERVVLGGQDARARFVLLQARRS